MTVFWFLVGWCVLSYLVAAAWALGLFGVTPRRRG